MGLFKDNKKVGIPEKLKDVKPKVGKLYHKGNVDSLSSKKILAVVGSRRITQYGQRVIEKIIPNLVDAGVTIVSGFMYGVDQEAHKVCLECGGKTIAVLGWGIDWEVEVTDKKLYQEIEDKGLILSEYDGKKRPQLWMFPQRNRIVAGLADAVLVVEAAEKSGSLITAKFAKKFGKKLFAVPGPVTSKTSEGTNNLIKSKDAVMATSGKDILTEMAWNTQPSGCHPEGNKSTNQVISLLENESLTMDELAMKLKIPVEKLAIELTLMEVKGLLAEENGKYYINLK